MMLDILATRDIRYGVGQRTARCFSHHHPSHSWREGTAVFYGFIISFIAPIYEGERPGVRPQNVKNHTLGIARKGLEIHRQHLRRKYASFEAFS